MNHPHDDDSQAPLAGRARRALDDYAPPPVPRRLVDRVVAATRPPAPRRRRSVALPLAAGAAVAIAGVVLLTWRARPLPPRTHVAVAQEQVTLGERVVVTLEAGAALRWAPGGASVEQLAGIARYQVSHGGAPFVVTTPAGTVSDRGTRFDVEVRPMKTGNKLVLAGGAAAAALAVYVLEGRVEVANARGTLVAEAGERVVATADQAPRLAPVATAAAGHPRAVDPERAARRASLLAAISAARARREAAAPAAPAKRTGDEGEPARATLAGDLDKDYVRTQVRALLPLISGCYDDALRDEPGLAGDLVVRFTVTGEPGVGGLVTSSEIDPASTIVSPALSECVSQTMYAVDLQPPADGGDVEIVYPFSFSTEP
jgi:hypothetical protein